MHIDQCDWVEPGMYHLSCQLEAVRLHYENTLEEAKWPDLDEAVRQAQAYQRRERHGTCVHGNPTI